MKTSLLKLAVYFIVAGLLTLLIYGNTLSYPFFFDDAVHFRLLKSHSLGQIWVSAEGFPYFRPLTFTVWKLIQLITGRFPPLFLHGILLTLHALNGGLIGWLLDRKHEEFSFRPPSLLGIALFVLFPFSYQAVTWVASLAHPLVTFLILAAIASWAAHREGWKPGFPLALLLGFLAPFAHETGILTGPLLSLFVWFTSRKIDRKSFYLWISAPLFLSFWLWIPKTRDATEIQNLKVISSNIFYYLQGLTFPFFEFSYFWNVPRESIIYTFTLEMIGFLILTFLVWTGRLKRIGGLGLAWFMLAIGPAVLLLPFSYTIDGPRLLYLASAGVALMWIAALTRKEHISAWRHLISYGAFVFIFLLSFIFIRHQIRFFDWGSQVVKSMVQAVKKTPGDGPLLFVNVPAWLSSHDSPFKIGHDGATLIAEYAPLHDLLIIHDTPDREITAVTYPDILQQTSYYYGFYGASVTNEQIAKFIETSDGVWVTRHTVAGPKLFWAGKVNPTDAQPPTFLATFDHHWRLLASEITTTEQQDTLRISLLWQCGESLSQDWTILLHVYDRQGQMLTQGDGNFLLNTYSPSFCPYNTLIKDIRYVHVGQGADFSIGTGLYNRQSSDRLTAYNDKGEQWYNNIVILPFAK